MNAEMERKVFTTKRKVSSPCTSLVNSAEQYLWFRPSVKFAVSAVCLQLDAKSERFIDIILLIQLLFVGRKPIL